MIVPMKKVSILCLAGDQEDALRELCRQGVVHLQPIQAPAGSEVDDARSHYQRISRVLEVVPVYHEPAKKTDEEEEHAEPVVVPELRNMELVDHVEALVASRRSVETEKDSLRMELRRLEPWGDFKPEDIQHLRDVGLCVKLYKLSAASNPQVPDGAVLEYINRTKDGDYAVLFAQKDVTLSDAKEFRLPAHSQASLKAHIAEMDEKLADIERQLVAVGMIRHEIEELKHQAEDEKNYFEAKYGMGSDDRLAYLQGFCPVEDLIKIKSSARKHGWGLVVKEPGPDDRVPTEIRNPKWVEPIKSIFDMTGLVPGYRELDISPVFLVALSIFFAMLVGDAGYGLVLLGLTMFARKKMSKAPAYPFTFMYIMCGATIFWGILTGTYFGIGRNTLGLPYIHWLTDDNNVMFICFLLGAVHLTIAHAWRAWLVRNSPMVWGQIGWICSTWVMFLGARAFVLGRSFPGFGFELLIVGIALVAFSIVKSREWFGLVMLPLDVIGNFTDVVSYLRLFAVGTASYAVANAFNGMLTPYFGGFGTLMAAICLLAGHGLNISLCGLGILVHGVRLNTLEFSSHMGLEWSGFKYNPFRRKSTQDQ